MLCIYNTSTDPYFNLATEEYLLKEFSEDCFMLWKNEPTVVVGKHQNTNAEINSDYVRANNINVVRRLTGGGAVYHDLGNLNFTFIMNGGEHKQINFEKYTRPVLEVLNKLGINAKFEGRNDLRIDGKKISGNSEHIYRNRILHHGTLLYSSNMEPLGKALNIKPLKYKGRGVKSLSSEVTNISQHLSKPVSLTEFTWMLMEHIEQTYSDSQYYQLNQLDRKKINLLRDNKYSTWDWNYGLSPAYSFQKLSRTSGGNVDIRLNIKDGRIDQAKIYGDFFNKLDIGQIEEQLSGINHERGVIKRKLNEIKIENYFKNISAKEFLEALF